MELIELTDNFIRDYKKVKGKDLIIMSLSWKARFWEEVARGTEPKLLKECLDRVENEMAGLGK